MTQALEKAIAAVQALPAQEQDAIAAIILEELADEQRWDETFANSQSQLARLAEKARHDMQHDRVHEAGLDEL